MADLSLDQVNAMNMMKMQNELNQAIAGVGAAYSPSNILTHGQMGQQLLQKEARVFTVKEKIERARAVQKARDKILEFFQAQMELEPFKNDFFASHMWARAITAAIEQLEKEV